MGSNPIWQPDKTKVMCVSQTEPAECVIKNAPRYLKTEGDRAYPPPSPKEQPPLSQIGSLMMSYIKGARSSGSAQVPSRGKGREDAPNLTLSSLHLLLVIS